MHGYDWGLEWEDIGRDQKASNDASSGEPFNGVDYCRVVLIDRGEGCKARVTHRDEVDYPEAVDGGERSGKQCEG